MASECGICWTLIGQAAEGIRDRELDETADACAPQTHVQVKWLTTCMKQAAPQALIASA